MCLRLNDYSKIVVAENDIVCYKILRVFSKDGIKSPFQDFKKSLKIFPKLKVMEKDMLQLLYDSDLVSFTGRYMLLSKALEIVNALHPL